MQYVPPWHPGDNQGMSSAPGDLSPRRTPFWLRRPIVLERVALSVVLVNLIVAPMAALSQNGVLAGALASTALSALGFAITCVRPWPGVLLIGLAPLSASLLHVPSTSAWNVGVFAALYLALRGVPGIGVGATLGVANYLSLVALNGHFGDPEAAVAGITAIAAGAIGGTIRAQSQYWRELHGRAEDALATREAETNRRVAEERLRIARDLHDVVGHEIAVVNMHLGVAEVSLTDDPSQSRVSILAARAGVQSVLHETQGILDVLRRGEPSVEQNEALPEFSRIPALVESYRAVGVDVHAVIAETPSGLDPGVATAAFRIVQEALTNAQRHGTGPIEMRVEVDGACILIEVGNVIARRPGERSARRGYGVVGMVERATAAGGRLDVEEDGVRFRIRAQLRLDGSVIR